MLTIFIGRVLERLVPLDFKRGVDEIKQGLYHAGADWSVAIKAQLVHGGQNTHCDVPRRAG
jgi:hypothetical protein